MGYDSRIEIAEESGAVSGVPGTLLFPDGFLTDNGDGTFSADFGMSASTSVDISGATSLPTYAINGSDPTKVDIGAFDAWAVYTDGSDDLIKELYSYAGGTYEPTYPGGASQAITYIGFVVNTTTKAIDIVENAFYRDFTNDEANNMTVYLPTTRDTGTGNITVVTVKYVMGYRGASIKEKISVFKEGSEKFQASAYTLTPEASPLYTGSYFHIGKGSALTAGRNRGNDINQTYTIIEDPERTGGEAGMSVTVAGRGDTGNEGQQFYRVFGEDAKVLGGQAPMYEPTDADATGDYSALSSTKWAIYKLVIFPGSRLIVMQPSIDKYVSAAAGIAVEHVYDTDPYNTYDRWIPCLCSGYLALRGNFDPTDTWANNAGTYVFYDCNKEAV